MRRRGHPPHWPSSRSAEERPIHTRRASLLVLVLALALGACGTWDPTNQNADSAEPAVSEDADIVESGTVELRAGESTYSFSVDECFASPEDGIQVRGQASGGERLEVDYSADAPRDRTIQVTGENNAVLLDGNAAEGVEDPDLEIEDGGFSGTATFRSTDGSEVGGEMSGAC